MAYKERLRPKWVLQVYKRVGILLVEVYERVGKSVISLQRPKGITDAFYGCKT